MMRAIALVVREGCSGAEVMRRMKIANGTWQAWRAKPFFQAAMAEQAKEYEAEVWAQLRASAGPAAQTLRDVARNTAEKGSVRVMAANSILDRGGFKVQEEVPATSVPYASREEMVAALTAIPADVLAEALRKATGGASGS